MLRKLKTWVTRRKQRHHSWERSIAAWREFLDACDRI